MNTNKKILIFITIIGIFIVSSCKVKFIEGNKKVDNIKPSKLYENINSNEFEYENLSLKFSANIEMGEAKQGFGGIIRIQKDSIIWISIRVAHAIEGARLCFTKDSIKLINKQSNTYLLKNFESLATDFGIDLDYNSIQSILTNSFFLYPCVEDEISAISNFKQCYDQSYYCMSSISKRKMSKYYSEDLRSIIREKNDLKDIKDSIISDRINNENKDLVFQVVKIMPEIYRVYEMVLENYIHQQSLYINYEKQVLENNQYFPRIINMDLNTSSINLGVKINIDNVNVSTKKFSFPFKISEKYTEMTMP